MLTPAHLYRAASLLVCGTSVIADDDNAIAILSAVMDGPSSPSCIYVCIECFYCVRSAQQDSSVPALLYIGKSLQMLRDAPPEQNRGRGMYSVGETGAGQSVTELLVHENASVSLSCVPCQSAKCNDVSKLVNQIETARHRPLHCPVAWWTEK